LTTLECNKNNLQISPLLPESLQMIELNNNPLHPLFQEAYNQYLLDYNIDRLRERVATIRIPEKIQQRSENAYSKLQSLKALNELYKSTPTLQGRSTILLQPAVAALTGKKKGTLRNQARFFRQRVPSLQPYGVTQSESNATYLHRLSKMRNNKTRKTIETLWKENKQNRSRKNTVKRRRTSRKN
jgi:hypothetical protein